ncbi:MAG: non-homologous end-joining DNA ligase [Marmoricola sp.]
MRPMLATRGDRVPSGGDWAHEVKWDGMRVLVDTAGTAARLFSRRENDVTVSFPELHGLASMGDVLLDGEVVALAGGVPSFAALADRMHVTDVRRAARLAEKQPVLLVVFDLLRLDGRDLVARPLRERRQALAQLGLQGPAWQVPPTYDDGQALLAAAREQGLEGVVSKRLSSPYRPGVRSREWLKFPLRSTGSFIVGGYRHETGSDRRVGALLVGERGSGGLCYRGRVGSGVAGRAATRLAGVLPDLAAAGSPFVDEVPRVDREGTVWLRPELVVDVEYLVVTADGRLRQPAYRGIRNDLIPEDLE